MCVFSCFAALCITGSCQHKTYAMLKMVEGGNSPYEVACAMDVGGSSSMTRPECISYLLTQNKETK